MRTKDLTLTAMLTALALVVFIIESQIPPPIPIAGVKLGLANTITLTAMVLLNRRTAGLILMARIILGSILTGSVSSFLFAATGGLCAYLIMCVTLPHFNQKSQLWIVSVFGALFHNAGQLLIALLITQTLGILYYGLALIASAVITGVFTGLCAQYLIRTIRKMR